MKTKAAVIAAMVAFAFSVGHSQAWTPQKSSHFGVDGFESADFFRLQPLQLDTAYRWESAGLRNVNVAWNRSLSPAGGQFRWDVIEYPEGTYDWSKPDSFVKRIQTESLQLLVLVHPFARWDQPNKNGMNYDKPNSMTGFKRFIAKLVERYDGDGVDDMSGLLYPIEYYEIGNEPEGFTFGDSPGTFNDFMETVKAAYDTAKTAFPGVKIVIGGASPIYDSHGQNNGVDTFWKGALDLANVGNYFDVFNFHFFVGQYSQDISGYLTYWKQLLAAYGLSGKEIWLTETGTYSGTSTGPDGASWPNQSTEYQAGWWLKQSAYALANGVSKLFWVFYYSDQSDWRSTVAFVNLGKATKKAVSYTQKVMAEKIDAYASVTQNAYSAAAQNQTSGNFKFTVGGKPVYVVWNDQGGSATLTGFSSAKVKITKSVPNLDGSGNVVLDGSNNPTFQSSESNVSSGQVVVALTSVPVYVEESLGPPAAPTLLSPGDGATGVSVTTTLTWNSSSGAATYRVQVSTSSSFATTVFDDSTIVDTSKQVGPLAYNTTYFWRVSATSSGGTSSYAAARSFTTVPASVTVSGSVRYGNAGSSPVRGVNLTLTPLPSGNQTLSMSDSLGRYQFTGVLSGNYSLTANKTGGHPTTYVNAADALKAALFYADSTTFTLNSIQKLAADVNNDGVVNSADALQIVLRYVGRVGSFAKGDWVFAPAASSFSVASQNVANDIMCLAVGDVNGDAQPAGAYFTKGGTTPPSFFNPVLR